MNQYSVLPNTGSGLIFNNTSLTAETITGSTIQPKKEINYLVEYKIDVYSFKAEKNPGLICTIIGNIILSSDKIILSSDKYCSRNSTENYNLIYKHADEISKKVAAHNVHLYSEDLHFNVEFKKLIEVK